MMYCVYSKNNILQKTTIVGVQYMYMMSSQYGRYI